MTREEVWKRVSAVLREDFGRLLDVREVRRVRRVASDAWIVTVVMVVPTGDIHVADLDVEDTGVIAEKVTAVSIVEAVKRAEAAAGIQNGPPDELADFGADIGDVAPKSAEGLEVLSQIEEPVDVRVAAALARGDEASLREAQGLLPRLLIDHDRRGNTLLAMAAVETSLNEPMQARGYLEAAAREFADRFDLDSLEKAATLAMQIVGKDSFHGSPVHVLLERSRTRLTPLSSIYEAHGFAELDERLRSTLDPGLHLRTLAPNETLVTEGSPSKNIFVVRSGLLGVWLEKPTGGQWLVRCCFPGWLLGESSVLSDSAKCTATLKAQRASEVWQIDAKVIREIMVGDPDFGRRISETKQIHRIDSFFSMHETMGQLDVQVRDEMLSCIERIETFDTETIVLKSNTIPTSACLVARGEIVLLEDGKTTPAGIVEADSFYGVRDSIHQIAPSVAAIAKPGTTVAFFSGERLQKLCSESPEHVVAVLERLG